MTIIDISFIFLTSVCIKECTLKCYLCTRMCVPTVNHNLILLFTFNSPFTSNVLLSFCLMTLMQGCNYVPCSLPISVRKIILTRH